MKNLIWNNKYTEYIMDVLGTLCLTGVLVFLLNMADELYQTLRDIQTAKAVFMLAVFFFILQRVRLFNWQSLAVSLVYLPFGYMYRNRYIMAPDLFNCDRVVAWTGWILLLIIVDMLVYRKVNKLQNFRKGAIVLFILMAAAMTFCRNGSTDPIIFAVIFVFYLIPVDKKRWERILYQLCGAWGLCFVYRLVGSLVENPEVADNGRWYGNFLNIGDFGLFVAAVMTISLYFLYQAKLIYGRKSIPYIGAWLFMLPVAWTALRVSTITMFIGVGCVILMGFIILPHKGGRKGVLLKTALVFTGIPIVVLAGLLLLRTLANTDEKYWLEVLKEGNVFIKPIADLIRRAHSVFDRSRTFADCGVFEEGTLINYLDLVTSGRLSIIKSFSEYFTFTGVGNMGMHVGTYWAYNTHNAYSQFILSYGYLGGGMFCLWFLFSLVQGVRQYLCQRKKEQLFFCIWMAMVAGVMLGERVYLISPVIVMALVLSYPLVVKLRETGNKLEA